MRKSFAKENVLRGEFHQSFAEIEGLESEMK
jgi:hypothetical protein